MLSKMLPSDSHPGEFLGNKRPNHRLKFYYLLVSLFAISCFLPIFETTANPVSENDVANVVSTADASHQEDGEQQNEGDSNDEDGSNEDSESGDDPKEQESEKKPAKEEAAPAKLDLKKLNKMIFTLIGGLGIFLLGMKNMSEGMQAVAGSGLRKLIGIVTSNRLFATSIGVIVTCVVQSSSVTTVMVVGFVNSGAMNLTQAVGIIMGANIGTTITGWILVLKIGKYGLLILGISAGVYLFTKRESLRYWAMATLGVGMVFFGLELMKDACAIIKQLPEFEAWFKSFAAEDGVLGLLGCITAGCILTFLVQSSSATLGITMSLAFEGVITYETAAALVLGENIGTTITAYLASLGATTNARRAAYFHILFNVVGVCWITLIFFWYIRFIPWVVNLAPWLEAGDINRMEMDNGRATYPYTQVAIAATHTVFNIVNTLMFFPFLNFFVNLMTRIVPDKKFKEKPHLTDLDIRMLETPLLAIEQSHKELGKMSDGCEKMLDWYSEQLQSPDPDQKLSDRIHRREAVLDSIHDEMAAFITNLLTDQITHGIAEEGRLQLRMADEFESVSDYIADLARFDRKLRKKDLCFTKEQVEELMRIHELISSSFDKVSKAQGVKDKEVLLHVVGDSKNIRGEIKRARRAHLDSLSTANLAPQVSVAFLASLNAYSRVNDHTVNIAEVISGEK